MPSTILAFNTSNQLAIRRHGALNTLAFTAPGLTEATALLEATFTTRALPPPQPRFTTTCNGLPTRVHLAQVAGQPSDAAIHFSPIDTLLSSPNTLDPALAAVLAQLDPHLIDIPCLHLGENDFIYKFRPDKARNSRIYQRDPDARSLYHSQLCAAIKTLSRANERTASSPVPLDFGAVRYLIPSHFGFCLGVKNAIERAYETLAENPGRRVFMLSELIHNPYVNDDLRRRGLRYLQTDKGLPIADCSNPKSQIPNLKSQIPNPQSAIPNLLWDSLTPDDIVIIPAFGATDDDKRRLIRKGLPVLQYDATCMLVEKVWKAARAFGREGYTIIIHGKHEHEETKATFSNARRHAPALIVRNLDEARALADIIKIADCGFQISDLGAPPPESNPKSETPNPKSQISNLKSQIQNPKSEISNLKSQIQNPPTTIPRPQSAQSLFQRHFAGKHTPSFDIARDLQRVAVVNQTTLLMNETLDIIKCLRDAYAAKYGPAEAAARVGGNARRDTLCYATQVNQDALSRALSEPLDAAIVIGGKNSSNTHQLYRLCEQRLGARAFFIQSERNIRALDAIEHYHFPARAPLQARDPLQDSAALQDSTAPSGGTEPRPLPRPSAPGAPLRILITGGASCPDGIIQQVITRINSLHPAAALRPIEAVLADLQNLATGP